MLRTLMFSALTAGSMIGGGSVQAADSKGRVLLVLSSTSELALKEGRTVPTGYYLDELAVPAQQLLAAGYEVIVASPTGKKPVRDARSNDASFFGNDQTKLQRALKFVQTHPSLQNPKTLKAVAAEGIDQFAGIYVPGGHAPMNDLMRDPDLGKILVGFHQASKPTAFLCHGPVASLAALPKAAAYQKALAAGDERAASAAGIGWQYAGYRMTIFANAEEKPIEAGVFKGHVQFYVADALARAGGRVENGPSFQSFVVRDRELITGQNPASDHAIADALIKALAETNPPARATR